MTIYFPYLSKKQPNKQNYFVYFTQNGLDKQKILA